MTGKTHTAIGLAIGLAITFKEPIETQFAVTAATTLGALIPDLDHPKGELNQMLLLINNNIYKITFYSIIGAIFIYIYVKNSSPLFILLGLYCFALAISNHRSFTHSLLGLIFFSAIVKLALIEYGTSPIYKGLILGYISHLLADFFTTKGIKLFFPFKANISFPLTIKTDSFGEKFVFFVFISFCIVVLVFNFGEYEFLI